MYLKTYCRKISKVDRDLNQPSYCACAFIGNCAIKSLCALEDIP